MTPYEFAGYAAGFLTTIACVPQVVQSWRTRSVNDLSLGMLVVLTLGIALWIVYGLHHGNWPILATNAVSICLWSSLLWLKVKTRRRGE